MFAGGFSEGKEHLAILEEIEGVVSVASVEYLLQWLHPGRVQFDLENPSDRVSAAIEFARLADMCDIGGIDEVMAQLIKEVIVNNHAPSGPSEWSRSDEEDLPGPDEA